MRSVQIAELKNKLSAYLNFVRAGEEVLVRDRTLAIARIVPLGVKELDAEEKSLVADGVMTLPARPFDIDAFLANGQRSAKIPKAALQRAMNFAREDVNVSILGRKRRSAAMRSRAKK
jgi:antitoxin (DNA-binding transcriptional repressor) of toxin-antitoxin stability system